MAALLGRTQLGLKDVGCKVTVANDPKARLMYYLSCVCTVLELNDQQNLNRLKDYVNYSFLSEVETDALVTLCFLFSPENLIGKVFFQDDDMCGDSSNKFFELSAVSTNMIVSDSILIGGQQRAVHNIMTFKQTWLLKNWIEPMQHFALRLARIATGQPAQPESSVSNYRNQTDINQSSRAVVYQIPEASNDSLGSSGGCCCIIL